MFKFIYNSLLEFLFPYHCPSCNAYVEFEGQWCDSCFKEIIRYKNLAYDKDIRMYISPVITIGKYDKGLRQLIHNLKYNRDLSTLPYIKTLFKDLDMYWQFQTYDFVIPVPLHLQKYKQRGFNQVEKIFYPWIIKNKLNYADILIRTKKTKSQYKLNITERQKNLQNAFALKENVSVKNAKCLLLDDIFTSGNTLKNCAKVLLDNGAVLVSGLVLASKADD